MSWWRTPPGGVELLINQAGHRRDWIGLRLVDGDPPRDMLGARVSVSGLGWRDAPPAGAG